MKGRKVESKEGSKSRGSLRRKVRRKKAKYKRRKVKEGGQERKVGSQRRIVGKKEGGKEVE